MPYCLPPLLLILRKACSRQIQIHLGRFKGREGMYPQKLKCFNPFTFSAFILTRYCFFTIEKVFHKEIIITGCQTLQTRALHFHNFSLIFLGFLKMVCLLKKLPHPLSSSTMYFRRLWYKWKKIRNGRAALIFQKKIYYDDPL